MGHSSLKNTLNKRKFTTQLFSQHNGAVLPHTVIPRLTIVPLRPHATRTDCHWAWEKQPVKEDRSSLADSDCEI